MDSYLTSGTCVQSPADMAFDAIVDLAAFSPGNRPDTRSPEQVAEEVPDSELAESSMGGFFKFAEVGSFAMHMGSGLDRIIGRPLHSCVLAAPEFTGTWVDTRQVSSSPQVPDSELAESSVGVSFHFGPPMHGFDAQGDCAGSWQCTS